MVQNRSRDVKQNFFDLTLFKVLNLEKGCSGFQLLPHLFSLVCNPYENFSRWARLIYPHRQLHKILTCIPYSGGLAVH